MQTETSQSLEIFRNGAPDAPIGEIGVLNGGLLKSKGSLIDVTTQDAGTQGQGVRVVRVDLDGCEKSCIVNGKFQGLHVVIVPAKAQPGGRGQ